MGVTPLRVGAIDVIPLSDGTAMMPQGFWVGFDFDKHPGVLAADGRIHMPIGCYLVRTGEQTVLLDAGMGPTETEWGRGGDLPDQLRAVGVEPADIDVVVCTHLHLDHAGWLVQDGAPYFSHATVRYGAGDWKRFVDDAEADDPIADGMRLLWDAGRLDPIEGDMVSLAPGLTARYTPGHTDGHYSLVVASGDERLFLLGDAVECPLQVEEDEFSAWSDVDPKLAKQTREAMWRELEGTDAQVGAAHFPGLQVGRILVGEGKRYFQ